MVKLGLQSLNAAGLLRWPLLARWQHNICPAAPDHDWTRIGCRRCGKLRHPPL